MDKVMGTWWKTHLSFISCLLFWICSFSFSVLICRGLISGSIHSFICFHAQIITFDSLHYHLLGLSCAFLGSVVRQYIDKSPSWHSSTNPETPVQVRDLGFSFCWKNIDVSVKIILVFKLLILLLINEIINI